MTGHNISRNSGTQSSSGWTNISKNCNKRRNGMADNSSATTSAAPLDESFTLTRTFDAPRELVFKVWTEAEHLKHWWGPKGMTMLVTRLDLRPGGMFHYSMRTSDGREMWGRFIFREIVPPERIV